MHTFQSILTVTFPFFALVLCGYVATRRNLLPIAAIPGLSTFILFFALPAMLFRFGAATPLAQLLDLRLILLYSACGVLLLALTLAASRNQRIGLKDAAFGALVAVFPNSGFMGIPLILALLGEAAVGVVIVTILVDSFLTSSICLSIAQMQGSAGEPRHWRTLVRAFVRSLRGAAYNPMPWAIAAGVLFGWSGLTMPEPVGKSIALLSDAASRLRRLRCSRLARFSPATRCGRRTAAPDGLRADCFGEAVCASTTDICGRSCCAGDGLCLHGTDAYGAHARCCATQAPVTFQFSPSASVSIPSASPASSWYPRHCPFSPSPGWFGCWGFNFRALSALGL